MSREAITEALRRLDTMPQSVTDWEADFLESLLRRGCRTSKQRAVLARMVEQYLRDGALSAEILGQARLWKEHV